MLPETPENGVLITRMFTPQNIWLLSQDFLFKISGPPLKFVWWSQPNLASPKVVNLLESA